MEEGEGRMVWRRGERWRMMGVEEGEEEGKEEGEEEGEECGGGSVWKRREEKGCEGGGVDELWGGERKVIEVTGYRRIYRYNAHHLRSRSLYKNDLGGNETLTQEVILHPRSCYLGGGGGGGGKGVEGMRRWNKGGEWDGGRSQCHRIALTMTWLVHQCIQSIVSLNKQFHMTPDNVLDDLIYTLPQCLVKA